MTRPESLEHLEEAFRRLPSIGKKTAQRLALHLVTEGAEKRNSLIQALEEVKEKLHPCPICGNITEEDLCSICSNVNRRKDILCVVEDVTNLMAIENSASYSGLYHVLHGLLSPMDGRGPDEIGLAALLDRIDQSNPPITEVILAISATLEGETTMLFLADILKVKEIKVSRIASGIPVGGNLEYYDELTLMRALQDRREMD